MHLIPIAVNIDVQQLNKTVAALIDQLGQGMLLTSGEGHHDPYHRWDLLAAIGFVDELIIPFDQLSADPLQQFGQFIKEHPGWCFFHLTYDLKNTIEQLSSGNPDRIRFPELAAFTPKLLVALKEGGLYVDGDQDLTRQLLQSLSANSGKAPETPAEEVTCRTVMRRDEYLNSIGKVLAHIARGDIYELNYCQEFFGSLPETFAPANLWQNLSALANAPFGAFYRHGSHLLCSASPERFLWRQGDTIVSQPMKGTIRRGTDPLSDEALKTELFNDPKERAENVMIVDLVRNDLSHIATKGSVIVPELFGIYTFSKVHQMISTVQATLRAGVSLPEILRATFPMGSMTGAPKISAMQITETLEQSRRGLYSGTVGYITPEGDFDMNVIIRSVVANLDTNLFSFQTGGAITFASTPAKEYEESLLKAGMLLQALNARLISE